MDTSRKICTVLTNSDLSRQNIQATIETIEKSPNRFFLLSLKNGSRLWNVIEDLKAGKIGAKTLTKIRMAYNLEFKLQTIFKTSNDFSAEGKEVKTFADLLELLEFDNNLNLVRADYHIVINDDGIEKSSDGTDAASQAVAQLFQQAIFLNINFDIQKKSEIKMAIMKDRFRANYSALVAQLKQQKDFLNAALQHAGLNDSGKKRVREMYDALKQTEDRLAEAKKRPLRIAAMGTKKAGKSVVINSLLRRDYAPTSSLLPTPNTVKYIPSEVDSLRLDYAGKRYTFKTVDELKSFIGDEFKKAQRKTGKGSDLPDMTVYYPCKELNGYEVWDTPGPNFAGAGDEHRKNAENCIREVDVCIFVMNYSSYLTDDEVKFLKQIREFFQAAGKFYSLFITVNRIDERYSSAAEKSIVYVLDYIGSRLEGLGYKNIVTFGTSALQSFYLDKLIELSKVDGATEPPFIDSDTLEDIEKNHMHEEDDSITTQINFIDGAINNLRRFHGIKGATEKEIEAFSGIPQLRRYTKYIGDTKADMEIVNKVVGDCEGHFAIIKSALDVVVYQTLSDEAKKYLETVVPKIDEVNNMAGNMRGRLDELLNLEALRKAKLDAQRQSDSIKEQSIIQFDGSIGAIVKRSDITDEKVRNFVEDPPNNSEFMDSILREMAVAFTNVTREAANLTELAAKAIVSERKDKIQSGLRIVTQEIIDKVKTINVALKKSGVPTITLPSFPVSVSMNVSGAKFNFDSIDGAKLFSFAENSIKVVKRTGFFGTIADWFTTKRVVDIDELKQNIVAEIKRLGHAELERECSKLSTELKQQVEEAFNRFDEDCTATRKIYKTIFENTHRNIVEVRDETGKKKAELDRNIAALKEISAHFQPYFRIWSDIRVEDE